MYLFAVKADEPSINRTKHDMCSLNESVSSIGQFPGKIKYVSQCAFKFRERWSHIFLDLLWLTAQEL